MPLLSLRADPGVGAIAVSPNARDIVLAGRSGLYIVDYHQPLALPRWLPLRSAWEVASVQWCPSNEARIVSSNNQKVLVWNLNLASDKAIEFVLHGHHRAVSDVDFSATDPPMLATSSIDSTVKLWDLRVPRTGGTDSAALTFADFDAGALQARWNPVNENQIASAHNNRVLVWDKRNYNVPYASITAHQSECNGIRYLADGRILSCSTDGTVKLWDPKPSTVEFILPELTINAGFPVWRALPTPYELGAAIVPLRGDRGVHIINLANIPKENTLEGVKIGTLSHPASVKDALYFRHPSPSQYALATWGKDAQLRVWDGKPMLELPHSRSAAGCKDTVLPPLDQTKTLNMTEQDRPYLSGFNMFDLPGIHGEKSKRVSLEQLDWIAGVQLNTSDHDGASSIITSKPGIIQPANFSQELEVISQKFPRIEVLETTSTHCKLSLLGPWSDTGGLATVEVDVSVPTEYPNQPFQTSLHAATGVSQKSLMDIQNYLDNTCLELAAHGAPQLEVCVRYLVGDNPSIAQALAYCGKKDIDTFSSSSSLDEAIEPLNSQMTPTTPLQDPTLLIPESPSSMDDVVDLNGIDNLELGSVNHALDNTPLPKNSGAVWSKTGKLVCFFNKRPVIRERGPLPLDKVFAEADDSDDNSAAPFASDSDDFEMDSLVKWPSGMRLSSKLGLNPMKGLGGELNRSRSRTLTTISSEYEYSESAVPTIENSDQEVVLRNFVHLWPSRPDVAAEYRHDVNGNPLDVAEHNLAVAERFGLNSDAKIWRLLLECVHTEMLKSMQLSSKKVHSPVFDWGSGFMGLRSLLPRIATELERQNNIQMLACITCLLSMIRSYSKRRELSQTHKRNTAHNSHSMSCRRAHLNSIMHSDSSNLTSADSSSCNLTKRNLLSGSTSSMPEKPMFVVKLMTPDVVEGWGEWDPEMCRKWVERSLVYREQYAKLLHVWGLDIKRAEILKLNWEDPLMLAFKPVLLKHVDPESAFDLEAPFAKRTCELCKRPIARLFKGCLKCLHSMHNDCAQEWWGVANECPAACGCECKQFVPDGAIVV